RARPLRGDAARAARRGGDRLARLGSVRRPPRGPMIARVVASLLALVVVLSPSRSDALILCSVQTVAGPSYAAYDPLSGASVDATGRVDYRCLNVTLFDTVVIQISKGQSATFTPRTLKAGSVELGYNLYTDASHQVVWGDGTGGTGEYG